MGTTYIYTVGGGQIHRGLHDIYTVGAENIYGGGHEYNLWVSCTYILWASDRYTVGYVQDILWVP